MIVLDLPLPGDDQLATFQQTMLTWFATAARDLPWRHTRDPYRILVSEMMLQQTQVERVLPRYIAFLEVFPDLDRLAAAPTAEVIRMWAGLGYNRRAVNLQRIARIVLTDHAGQFPQEMAVLRQLPGIGPYTAGAIACFAFEQDVAFMDTNIRRVLLRSLVGRDQPAPDLKDRDLLPLAEAIVPPGQSWAWNQAVMELGALICTATTPACWRCPLRDMCRIYASQRRADEATFHPDTSIITYPVARTPSTRRVAEQPAERFSGSNRYYRGRIISVLRTIPMGESVSLVQLGIQIKADFQDDQLTWLRGLVAGLVRDGLAELVDDQVYLPGASGRA